MDFDVKNKTKTKTFFMWSCSGFLPILNHFLLPVSVRNIKALPLKSHHFGNLV